MTNWNRTGYAPRDKSGQLMAGMDAEDSEPMDDDDVIGRALLGPVRLVVSLGLVAAAAAGVLTFLPETFR